MTAQQDRRLDSRAPTAETELARRRVEERRYQSGPVTAGEYEREAELTRRRLADHLDELSERLTPGQVFDEVLSYSRVGGGTFFRAFTNAMRESPLPSLLIGAGCMMFLSEKMGIRPGNGARSGRPMTATAEDPYGYGAARGPSHADIAARMSEASDRVPGVSGNGADAAGRVSGAASRMTGTAASSARSAAASVQAGLSGAAESASRQTSNAAAAVADTVRQTSAAVGDSAAGAADAVRGTARDVRDQASAAAEQVRRGAQSMAGAVRDTAASATGALADTASSMSGAVADTASSMSGVLAERRPMSGAIADTASTMSGVIADTAGRTRRQAAEAVRQGRDGAVSLVSDQPLLAAAIGVAIGAALASLLPPTETEDEFMGEASDQMKGTAGQVGSDVLESAKSVASKVADSAQTAAREAAREAGFSPSAVAEAARHIGEGVREGAQGAVGDAARKVGEGVQRGAQSAMKEPMTGTGPQEGSPGCEPKLIDGVAALAGARASSPGAPEEPVRRARDELRSKHTSEAARRRARRATQRPRARPRRLAPWRIPWRGWKDILWRTYEKINETA